jgi:fructose-specific component phosphotransferase system IIB-like protein
MVREASMALALYYLPP